MSLDTPFSQEEIDAAAQEENAEIQKSQITHLQNRVVMLRAQNKRLESALAEANTVDDVPGNSPEGTPVVDPAPAATPEFHPEAVPDAAPAPAPELVAPTENPEAGTAANTEEN